MGHVPKFNLQLTNLTRTIVRVRVSYRNTLSHTLEIVSHFHLYDTIDAIRLEETTENIYNQFQILTTPSM